MERTIVECSICGNETTEYIEVLHGYICQDCEKQISSLPPSDKTYEVYNLFIKRMWKEYLSVV